MIIDFIFFLLRGNRDCITIPYDVSKRKNLRSRISWWFYKHWNNVWEMCPAMDLLKVHGVDLEEEIKKFLIKDKK
jgi:hypothetical protein